MEELRSIKKWLLSMVFVTFSIASWSQDSFVVFKKEGSPTLMVNDSTKMVLKGSRIPPNCDLRLKADDAVMFIDKSGACYKMDSSGTYSYDDLAKIPQIRENASFTKKYFSYVWNQFIKNTVSNSKTGVVYRNDNIVLLKPFDSVRINLPEIEFTWTSDSLSNYFLLKDIQTDHITKLGVSGKKLTLFIDNQLLKRGQSYQWAIAQKPFPDLEKLEFYNFTLLTRDEFKALKPELETFKTDLLALGFSADEVKLLLCRDYRICY